MKIGKQIVKNLDIIKPHVKIPDITFLNFVRMKEMGMDKIIFVKDNTLTKTGEVDFIDKDVWNSYETAVEAFGDENILIVS